VKEKGLTIGGYESAGLADLVAAWILEMTEELFDSSIYNGIYRDDGINITEGEMTLEEIEKWLDKFQGEVNKLTESTHLQFTLEVWNPDAPEGLRSSNDDITIHRKDFLPYLDTELFWHRSELKFRVHVKPNQQLKYLNRSSTHPSHVFKAVPTAIIKRLAQLTSLTTTNKNQTIDKLYPDHADALKIAGLNPKKYPTLIEAQEEIRKAERAKATRIVNPYDSQEEKDRKNEAAKVRKKSKDRTIWFCTAFSKFWDKPISRKISSLIKKYNLTWLRVTVSYLKYSNINQMFQSDLKRKCSLHITETDLPPRPCNCNATSKRADGKCLYNGECRQPYVVYELKDTETGKSYIGETQRYLKVRTAEHLNDVYKVIKSGRELRPDGNWYGTGGYSRADAFAKYHANRCRDLNSSSEVKAKLKETIEVKILWQGDRLKCMNSARTPHCRLCMNEKKIILSRFRHDRSNIINDRSELYGSCKCTTKFHKLNNCNDPTLRTRKTQKKSTSSSKSRQKRRTTTPSPVIMSSCETCYTPYQQTMVTIEKLPAINPKSIGRFVFKNQVVRPINIEWKELKSDEVKVPYPSLWQFEIANPHKLVMVGPPRMQLGLIDTNIHGLPNRDPIQTPSNLEIAQITEAAKRNRNPKVAETLAYINLLHPERVVQQLRKTNTVMV